MNYDKQGLRANVVDRTIWALGMNGITPKTLDTWLFEQFGKHLADLGGLRGFCERYMFGGDDEDDETLHMRFMQWRGGTIILPVNPVNAEAEEKLFADRLAACLRHHRLTMQEAAVRFEQHTGQSLDTFDLRQVPSFAEDLSVCRALAEMFEVDLGWLMFGEDANTPDWYEERPEL